MTTQPDGVFVTGTDTGVGKTLVSALLTRALDATYWKPIQTGLAEEEGDGPTLRNLARIPPERLLPPAYEFQAPLAPLAAAERENALIDLQRLTRPPCSTPLVVEGAGGLMVPVTPEMMMIDLIARLKLPALLVARSGLGTINHTLLSIEALRRRGIDLLGVVMNGADHSGNTRAIETFGRTRCLFHLPHFDTLGPEQLAEQIPLVKNSIRVRP